MKTPSKRGQPLPNYTEYLKLEDQLARLPPIDAMAACHSIGAMIAGQIGCTREQYVKFAGDIFDSIAPEMNKGEHWLLQSRRVTPTEH